MSSSSNRVISNTSLEYLKQNGNNAEFRGGFWTISLQTVSSFDSDNTIEVPDKLNFPESLQFRGLQTAVGNQLYQKWRTDSNNPFGPGQDDDVVECARSHLRGKARAQDGLWESDDWDAALKLQGVKEDLCQWILNPRFKNIRLTQSDSEWALDTLDLACNFLDGLHARLQKKKKTGDLRSVSPNPSAKPSRAIKPSSSLTSVSHVGNDSLKLSIEAEVPTQVPGRTILHKGGVASRLTSVFKPDGSLELSKIVLIPPVDFHPTRYDLYSTKQWEVASQYANYAHNRFPTEQPAVMTVAVPISFLSNSVELFGSDWNKIFWCSRNRNALIEHGGQLPKEFARYENAETLVGESPQQGPIKSRR